MQCPTCKKRVYFVTELTPRFRSRRVAVHRGERRRDLNPTKPLSESYKRQLVRKLGRRCKRITDVHRQITERDK